MVVPDGHHGVSATTDVRVLYDRLAFIAGIPACGYAKAAVQEIVLVDQVLERIHSPVAAVIVQEPYFYVLRILEAAELKRSLYGVFQKRTFAVLVTVEELRLGVDLVGVEVAYLAGAFPVYGLDYAAYAISGAMGCLALLVCRRCQLPVVYFKRRYYSVYVLKLAVPVSGLEIRTNDFVLVLVFFYIVCV